MSMPAARGQRSGTSSRGARGASTLLNRGRGSSRGSSSLRGRGRGTSSASATGDAGAGRSNDAGLLQKLRHGTAKRGGGNKTSTSERGRDDGSPTPYVPGQRGRGARNAASSFTSDTRGHGPGFANNSKTFKDSRSEQGMPSSRAASPVPTSQRDFMNAIHNEFNTLKQSREKERARAVRDGFLADPDKKTSLDKAITPVGTCTDMCPRFERVERINSSMVDKAEKVYDENTGKDMPSEDRMVKRFRRSAAGYDEQLPSDIRTPATLKRTLDYLLDEVIGGGERLATIQKFVWDRTRGIRNDFSIQQVTSVSDVQLAVECFERIARFHVVSLHQLSNPDNLLPDEHFDAFQEREQLNNTLLSLMYYYDDHRDRVNFPNEAEFRAYLVIFEIASMKPDIEDRLQSWPTDVLQDERVKTAIKLYGAAGDTTQLRGPLQPFESAAIAQANGGKFWNMLASKSVPYVMACLAELYFHDVRFAALNAIWKSCKQQPQSQQAKSRDWALSDLSDFLGFDTDDQTKDFCSSFDLFFVRDESGNDYLNLTANSAKALDNSSTPSQQIFSHNYVEKKRYHRSLAAVINGLSVADAVRTGSTESHEEEDQDPDGYNVEDDDQSMFVPEQSPATLSAGSSSFSSSLNPGASSFTPFGQSTTSSPFGTPTAQTGFAVPAGINGIGTAKPAVSQVSFSPFGRPTETGAPAPFTPKPFGSPLSTITNEPPNTSVFGSTPTTSAVKPSENSGIGAGGSNTTLGGLAGFGKPTVPPQTNTPLFGGLGTSFLSAKQSTSAASSSQPPPFICQAPSEGATTLLGPATTSAPNSQPLIGQQTQVTTTQQPLLYFTTTADPTQTNSSLLAPPAWSTLPPQPQAVQSIVNTPPPFSFSKTTQHPPSKSSDTILSPFTRQPTPQDVPKTSIEVSQPTNITDKASFDVERPPEKSSSATPSTSLQPHRSTTPPFSPRHSSPKPAFTAADREKAALNIARVGFTQTDGLISSFLDVALRELLTTIFKQHQQELRATAIASIRERILSRKFGYLWRQRAWNLGLNRRARNRRQLFAESIRAEQARQQRSEEELEEILKAAQESRRVQKEIEEAAKIPKKSSVQLNGVVKVAGQKRKSFSGQDSTTNAMAFSKATIPTSGHKRSKTVSTSGRSTSTMDSTPPVPGFNASAPRLQHVSIFSPAASMRRSTSNSDLHKSQPVQKLDATRTDYFRLKAMGVDPDTPIIPDTKQTLALRQQKEADERKAIIDRASRRVRVSSSQASSPKSMPPPPLPQQTPEPQQSPSTKPAPSPVEDDFLKKIREAREAMAEQTEWFKNQSVTLEKDIEQEEEFRKSQSSQEPSSPRSLSGLARTNGYEYLPAETKPGFSLSRTELRIRSTGAHGLATKPLRSTSDYVPVAMSKRSAISYNTGAHSSPGRKRSHDDMEPSRSIESTSTVGQYATKRPRAAATQPPHIRHQQPKPINGSSARNSFQLLQSIDPDDEEDDHDTEELLEEDDEEEEVGPSGPFSSQYQANGTYVDDEDLGDEGDELQVDSGPPGETYEYTDEEEDEEDLDEDDGYDYPVPSYLGSHDGTFWDEDQAEDAPTPATNPQISRAASSAPGGGSVDDAFVIDDSD